MLNKSLADIEIYKILKERGSPLLSGNLVCAEGNIPEVLEFIKASFPSYTRHNIQHSWTILTRICKILPKEAKEWVPGFSSEKRQPLTDVEIFGLILAAMFHDTGMINFENDSPDRVRHTHPTRSRSILEKFSDEKFSNISEHRDRLIEGVGFVIEAHGMTWNEMVNHESFSKKQTIMEQVFRPNILAILLRVGDLLDLDSDRSCDFVRNISKSIFDNNDSQVHHDRHKRVKVFYCESDSINIAVRPQSREEHLIWHNWLSYLEQDIEKANSDVFIGDLGHFRFPQKKFDLNPHPNAKYEVSPLRFEIDEHGKIWDVISHSIYTGKFDFIRELIQNAIDAVLFTIYSDPRAELAKVSPRTWRLDGYDPQIIVAYSKKDGLFEIVDNGIGMTRLDLEKFLFKVANSGYSQSKDARIFEFPSIATFGLGFVSVLIRASSVQIETRKRGGDTAYKVSMYTKSSEALCEKITDMDAGTKIRLALKTSFDSSELISFIIKMFQFPSVKISVVDLDSLVMLKIWAVENSVTISKKLQNIPDKGRDVVINCSGMSELVDLVSDATIQLNSTQRRFPKVIHQIEAKSFGDKLPEKPLVVWLDDLFRIEHISLGKKWVAITKDQSGIIWFPVTFADYDLGIEWQSFHGFAFSKNKLETGLVSVSSMYDVSRWQRKKKIFGFSSIDEDDVESELEMESDDIEGSHEYDDQFATNMLREKFKENQVDIIRVVIDDIILKGPSADLGGVDFLYFFDPLNVHLFQQEVPKDTQENFLEVIKIIESNRNEAFQDGIKIPVSACEISPIGACKSTINLLANARFKMNVTRASIDETPEVLLNWVSKIGAKIREEIFKTILFHCKEMDLIANKDALLSHHEFHKQDLLSYSARDFRNWIHDKDV